MEIVQLLLGRVLLPDRHPRAGEDYPLFGYAIDHPAGPVLVDTGAASGHLRVDELFAPIVIDLAEALGSAGVAIADVVMVINTHLHFDHVGRNPSFPGIPIVAQQAEYDAAQEEGYTVREWIEFPGARWRLVEGAVDVLDGIAVLPTPSHTVGHQAVVVRSGGRLEVIAGQALHTCDELEAGTSAEDLPEAALESFTAVARRIKALSPDRVWFSHDPRTWPVA